MLIGRLQPLGRLVSARAAGYVETSRCAAAAARTFVASAPKMAKAPSPPSMPTEFTGKTTMSISKIAGSKKDAGVDKLHDYDGPIGFTDAPWTPKSFVGKTPQELVEEVPPIPVNGARIACDGGPNPGLRYYNANHHH